MQQLHESLSRGEGKTAIAQGALWPRRHRQDARRGRIRLGASGRLQRALFVVAETPEALRAQSRGARRDASADSIRPRIRCAAGRARWFAANPGWFLILDNVDTKEALAEAEALLAKLCAAGTWSSQPAGGLFGQIVNHST